MLKFEKLEEIITPVLSGMGYDLVRVSLSGSERRKVLQIMAERKDLTPITIDDCANISREVSAILDVEDLIPVRYELEVSSPGLDRPLVKIADFVRFAGFSVKIETETPVNGAKRFKGKLLGISADEKISIELEDKKETVSFPFSAVAKAKLIITDELINSIIKGDKGF